MWAEFDMEIKIVSERDNPFFKRKDLKVDIAHAGEPTPKTDDLKKELAGKYKVDESQVSVDYILTRRGIGESTARIKILNEKPAVVEEPVEKPAEKPAEKKEKQKQEEPKEKPKGEAKEKKKEKVEEKPAEKPVEKPGKPAEKEPEKKEEERPVKQKVEEKKTEQPKTEQIGGGESKDQK